jgi:hypothetical protein
MKQVAVIARGVQAVMPRIELLPRGRQGNSNRLFSGRDFVAARSRIERTQNLRRMFADPWCESDPTPLKSVAVLFDCSFIKRLLPNRHANTIRIPIAANSTSGGSSCRDHHAQQSVLPFNSCRNSPRHFGGPANGWRGGWARWRLQLR